MIFACITVGRGKRGIGSRLEGLSSCHTHQPWPWLSDVVHLLNSTLLLRHTEEQELGTSTYQTPEILSPPNRSNQLVDLRTMVIKSAFFAVGLI